MAPWSVSHLRNKIQIHDGIAKKVQNNILRKQKTLCRQSEKSPRES